MRKRPAVGPRVLDSPRACGGLRSVGTRRI